MCFFPLAAMDTSKLVTQYYIRRTHIIPASSPGPNDDRSVRRDLAQPLRLSVHEYNVISHVPEQEGGFNVFLTHGTSFNKFFWQLIIDKLLSRPELRRKIRRLVAIDATNHGDSALLNKGRLRPTGQSDYPPAVYAGKTMLTPIFQRAGTMTLVISSIRYDI